MPTKWPLFLFREFAPPIEKYPLFAKMGTSVVYVLVGSGRAGKNVHVTEDIIVQGEMS